MQFTPDNIDKLPVGNIFVFGSNLSGYHGGGAARLAFEKFGANYGQGFGLQGKSYAIPTKGFKMSLFTDTKTIEMFVKMFLNEAHFVYPYYKFWVTKIGCGLALFEPKDIAPLFKDAIGAPNIILPEEFYNILTK